MDVKDWVRWVTAQVDFVERRSAEQEDEDRVISFTSGRFGGTAVRFRASDHGFGTALDRTEKERRRDG